MATPKTTVKKKLTKAEEAAKKKAREERNKEESKTRMAWMTKRDQLEGGHATATGQSLMPPSIAKGLVSREEYVNLLVVTYTEKLETEMNEANAEAGKLKNKLDAVGVKLYAALLADCKAQLDSPAMKKFVEAYTELTGTEPEVTNDIPQVFSVQRYGIGYNSTSTSPKGMPSVRFDCGAFHDRGPGREVLTLVDMCYFRIFGVDMTGRPKVKDALLPVAVSVGKVKAVTESLEDPYFMHPAQRMMERLGQIRAACATVQISSKVKVPEFTEVQQAEAAELVSGYQDFLVLENRIQEIQGLLQNEEKLRRKALAVMTAQAIGADGIKALPQLESKL